MRWFDKIAGSDFGRAQRGPKGKIQGCILQSSRMRMKDRESQTGYPTTGIVVLI